MSIHPKSNTNIKKKKKKQGGEFPGGPVVKNLILQWSGN